jgi:hypothetical protein
MKDFLTDYGAVVAPVFAIIGTYVALLVAQFFKENFVAKVILIGFSTVLSFGAVAALISNQHAVLAAKVAEQEKNRSTREKLGSFMREGLQMISDCSDNSIPLKQTELNDWLKRLVEWVRSNMGDAYAARLTNPAGVPTNIACRNADEAHNQVYRIVSFINFRLEQFLSEVGR